MPFVSRRRLAELHAAIARLRDRAERAEAAELVQARANGRLAGANVKAEDQLRAALAEAREELRRVRADRDGMRRQLDHAMGYDAEALAAIEAGATKKELTLR